MRHLADYGKASLDFNVERMSDTSGTGMDVKEAVASI
jgi:hypothetical protein